MCLPPSSKSIETKPGGQIIPPVIKFPLKSLVKTSYDQPFLEDTSQFGCLTLYSDLSTGAMGVLTFLQTYKFPNVLVLILYGFDANYDADYSDYSSMKTYLCPKNFKSLKYIMVKTSSLDDKKRGFPPFRSFPETEQIFSLKVVPNLEPSDYYSQTKMILPDKPVSNRDLVSKQ